jgi:cell division protease FtsH
MLAVTLAGHATEQLIFGDITTGAANDLEHATNLARKMVTEYGMSDKLGPRTFGRREEMVFLGKEITEQRNYSEKIAQEIDEEVHALIQCAHSVAREILTQSKAKLIQIAKRLLVEETLEEEELEKLFNEPPPLEEAASAS